MATSITGRTREGDAALGLLRLIFRSGFLRHFAVRLWDGTYAPPADGGPPEFTLVLEVPYALRAACAPPVDVSPGRAYVERYIDIEGNAEAAVDALSAATESLPKSALPLLALRLARAPRPPRNGNGRIAGARLHGRRHSLARDSAAIGFHYDQPAAFYGVFLDPGFVYSCGYWDDGVDSLEGAQRAKIDHILKKLRLRPGDRLLDIGCGWGALVMEAARRGARALGITLSHAQYEEASRRIAEAGLGERAAVELCDYRELGEQRFDKVVSVGMVEHVGRSALQGYFEAAYAALVPGGLFLNHGITDQTPGRHGIRGGFIDRFVFPDGELTAIGDTLAVAERVGFEVRDVENLREHYVRTLRTWVANLEAKRDEAIRLTDERTYRIWRLYMAGSAQGFNRGRMGLSQSLLAKPDLEGQASVPPNRRDLYS